MKKYNIYKDVMTQDVCKLLNKKFGYKAYGYYYEIISLILNTKELLLNVEDIDILAKGLKISPMQFKTFINLCTNCYNNKGLPLLSRNDKFIWNETILILEKRNKQKIKNINNKGRKKVKISESYKIKNLEYVNLTKSQYDKLINIYGKNFTLNAINILNEWLKSKSPKALKYLYKNNYGHFRKDSWVINETKKLLKCFEYQAIYFPDGQLKTIKVL